MDPPRYEAAEAEFREAIRLDPAWTKGYADLSATLCCVGRFVEAVGAAREAVRMEPNDTTFLSTLAAALLEVGENVEAIGLLTRAIDAKPMNETALRWFLAEAYHRRGQDDKAVEEWKIMDADGPTWDYEKWSVVTRAGS
jgi:tetratricopeptide (TPR) repeat protein